MTETGQLVAPATTRPDTHSLFAIETVKATAKPQAAENCSCAGCSGEVY
jgi:hypothetical protein